MSVSRSRKLLEPRSAFAQVLRARASSRSTMGSAACGRARACMAAAVSARFAASLARLVMVMRRGSGVAPAGLLGVDRAGVRVPASRADRTAVLGPAVPGADRGAHHPERRPGESGRPTRPAQPGRIPSKLWHRTSYFGVPTSATEMTLLYQTVQTHELQLLADRRARGRCVGGWRPRPLTRRPHRSLAGDRSRAVVNRPDSSTWCAERRGLRPRAP